MLSVSDRLQRKSPRAQGSRLLASFSLWLVLGGCAETNREPQEVYSVSGHLFINGKPAAGALVTLAPEAEGVPAPMGRVDRNGAFQMGISDQDLAKYPQRSSPVGDYHLLVRLPSDPSKPFSLDRLGGAYANPDVFDHLVSIELGENELEPIRIENAKIAP